MNQKSLNQIFEQYINRFDYINDDKHQEYYKWQVCQEFPILMKKALSSNDEELSKALYEVKKCTYNIIDSYTQPLMGLVEFSRKDNDPEGVRKLLSELYADDGGDLKVQEEKINDFFNRSNELIEKFSPGSFLYKQNSHSVSALLFLNDPDHHYMYKATQSKRFADCVEFYDDWGTGDNINLATYYRMCKELVSEIKGCEDLLATDASRFDDRLKIKGGKLHPDTEKHILAFDIIYCCSVYDLFSGVTYKKRNLKEKKLFLTEKAKAEDLKKSYEKAKQEAETLDEVLGYLANMISAGDKVIHDSYGTGKVTYVDERYLDIAFPEKEVKFGLAFVLANNIITLENEELTKKVSENKALLKKYESIPRMLEYSSKALLPYQEYLE